MQFVRDIGVYKYAWRDEAMRVSGGKAPVRVKWVAVTIGGCGVFLCHQLTICLVYLVIKRMFLT